MITPVVGAKPLSDIPHCSDLSLLGCSQATSESDFADFAFVQPDGSPIGVTYPGFGKKNRFVHYRADQTFYRFKKVANPFKETSPCHPRLELWKQTWKRQYTVCVDFDALLQEETKLLKYWGGMMMDKYFDPHEMKRLGCQVVAAELQKRIGNSGVVFQSAKGHYPKILLAIEYDSPVRRPYIEDVKALITHLLPEYVAAGCIDFQPTALSTTYIEWKHKDVIRQKLQNCVPIRVIKTSKDISFESQTEKMVAPATFKYYIASDIPKELKKKRYSKSYIKFLMALCAMPHLARDGFAISQVALARTVGVKQTTISKYMQRAKEDLLDVVDDEYIPNVKAKKYKAKGVLLKFLKEKIKDSRKRKSGKLPKAIKDGAWHQTMLSVAPIFKSNPGAFIPWIKTIQGWDRKDRLYQAQRLLKLIMQPKPKNSSSRP